MQRLEDFPATRRFWPIEAIDDWLRRTGRWSSERQRCRLVEELCRCGRLTRIRRGLYATASTKEGLPDPWYLPGYLAPDAVLTARSALEFRGAIAQTRRHRLCIYFTQFPAIGAGVTLHGVTTRPLTHPTALMQAGIPFTETERFNGNGSRALRVATVVRAFIDILERPRPNGTWHEILALIGTLRPFDLDRTVRYAKRLDNATTAAKIGWMLERHQEQFGVPPIVLDQLTRLRPRGVHYLSRTDRQSGRFLSRWNLVVPHNL